MTGRTWVAQVYRLELNVLLDKICEDGIFRTVATDMHWYHSSGEIESGESVDNIRMGGGPSRRNKAKSRKF